MSDRRPVAVVLCRLLRVARVGRSPWVNFRLVAWTLVAAIKVSGQVRRSAVRRVTLRPAPRVGVQHVSKVDAVLSATRMTCLRRSLVVQRFLLDNGEPVDLLIGTTAPSQGFRAHAWLDRPVEEHQGDGFTVVMQIAADRELTGAIPGGLR